MSPTIRPLHFNSLVIETTDRCNAKCGMCYQSAGPRGTDTRGDNRLPLSVALRVIEEGSRMPEIAKRLHVSGGESFIHYREVLALFRHGRNFGYKNIGATTNGYWAKNQELAEARCRELREAGADYLEVSFDFWHLPYIHARQIKCLFHAARAVGISIVLRTLTTHSHNLDEILQSFDDGDLVGVLIANGRVHPVGRAAQEIEADDIYYPESIGGCCEKMLNLTVTPNGNVYPCCAGADMTDAMASGNVLRDSLSTAVLKMRTDRTIREVLHSGTGALLPVVRQLGFSDRLQAKYTSICHLCWDLFKDPEIASALRAYYQEEHFAKLVAMLESSSLTEEVRT